MKEKSCIKCDTIKLLKEFNKDVSMKDGYRSQCKQCTKEYYKIYRENNIDKIKECGINYVLNRRKTDSQYNMIHRIRERIRKAIRRGNIQKNNSTWKLIGCDKETLMNHLQATGELYDSNFNIYEYDSSLYHIDHIKTFEDVSKGIYTLEEVCHYTNLQILPAEINLSKGGTSWTI